MLVLYLCAIDHTLFLQVLRGAMHVCECVCVCVFSAVVCVFSAQWCVCVCVLSLIQI